MEKKAIVAPGVTPPEGDEGRRDVPAPGEKTADDVAGLETHPATRLAGAAERDAAREKK